MTSQMSAIELLKLGDADRQIPMLNKYWPYIMGVAMGVGSMCFVNFGTRRPVFSGIQKHIAAAGIGCVALDWVQKKRDNYYAERDAVLRHYVELHPEEFEEAPKKKIGDVIEPWIPIR